MSDANTDWKCNGWDDHTITLLEVGKKMSFRAKMQWLEESHRFVRRIAAKRPMIDKNGVITYPPGWTGKREGEVNPPESK